MLLERHVNNRLRRFPEGRILDRIDFADNGDVPCLTEKMEVLPERALARPKVFRESSIDDRDHRPLRVVSLVEAPSA